MATPSELLMECDDDDLQPWQRHAGKEAAQGKKDPAEDPERTTVILTLLPVSPTERPLVPARTLPAHTPGSPVARALVMTPAPPLASQPLVLTPVPPPASLPLQTVSTGSLPGQPIIVSTQTLQGVSTDQTNPMMGLILNGQPITLLPGGQLLPQPSSFQLLAPAVAPAQGVGGTGSMAGEAGRFTTLTIRSPTGVQTITTVASSRNLSVPSPPSPLPPPAITSPIITEVVSMGALESADSPALPLAKPAAASSAPSRSTPVFFPKARSPTRPQMCIRCGTRYTLVNALRGHMCICSIKIAQSLKRINSSKSSKAKKHSSKGSKSSDSSDSSSSSEEESTQTTKKRKKKEKNEKTSSRGKSSKGKQSPRPKSAAKRISQEGEGDREWRREGRKSGEREGKKSRKRKGERDGPGEEKRHKELGSEVRPVYGDPSSPILEAESRGKLIILAEDFYYGTDRNCRPDTAHKQIKPFKCVYCDRNISDNIKLMNHTKQHVELNREEDELVAQTSCDLCFRQFPTPYRLQGHIESVHGSFECTAKCKICEWAYESEPAFLQHMKNFHKPGEMPYVCQVCQFRSSFYSEVMDHFREAHSDTSHLICPYCLKVFRYGLNYQHHYIRHQKKTVFRCDCCRLQFLFAKERAEHKVQDHKTHIKPKQLEGLKAGTKVTIRTYAAAGSRVPPPEDVDRRTPFLPPRVIDVPPAPQVAVSPKRTPPESLAHLLTTFQTHSPETQSCVECSFSIPDFLSHYPTYVHCSLCRYRTCCSRAYANHMINNHVTRKRTSNYATMYESYPRERKMRCTSCRYSTTIGDMMANHLTDHPGHLSATFNTTDDLELSPIIDDTPLTGSFVPFDQLTAGTPQLSIKPLLASSRPPTPSPAPSPSPTPSMTIRLQGSLASIRDGVLEGTLGALDVTAGPANGHLSPPRRAAILDIVGKVQTPPSQTSPPASASPSPAKPLTVRQLTIVLYALCNGLPQAAQRYGTRPQDIRAWTQVQDRQRLKKEWRWCTDRIAEWVLSQREEQLPINEENLLQTATEALDEAQEIGDFYQWAVEFMLRHNLGLQAALASMVRPPLPRNVFESTRIFTRFMAKQTREQSLRPGDLAAVDELSVFVDPAELAFCGPGALQLFGEGCAPVDMVLACLADGTFLPPMLFVRAARADPDPALQGRVFLEASPGGFTDEQRLQLWLDKVWRPRWRAQGSAKNLLVMDTHRGHLADAYLAGLSGTSTIPAVIPIGCSARLQPLEVCVAPVLREFLQARWSQMAEGTEGAGPGLGELAARLADWLGELAACLGDRPEILQRSFKIVCTSPTEEETDSATAIMHFLTEALLGDQEEEKGEGEKEKGEEPAGGQEERKEREREEEESEASSVCMSPQAQLHAVRQVFEKDSDLESFHGFEDREVAEFMHHARASPCQ